MKCGLRASSTAVNCNGRLPTLDYMYTIQFLSKSHSKILFLSVCVARASVLLFNLCKNEGSADFDRLPGYVHAFRQPDSHFIEFAASITAIT